VVNGYRDTEWMPWSSHGMTTSGGMAPASRPRPVDSAGFK
jgi:hypothetical protein